MVKNRALVHVHEIFKMATIFMRSSTVGRRSVEVAAAVPTMDDRKLVPEEREQEQWCG